MDRARDDLHVCLPGRVLAYDAASRTATIEPQIPRVLLSRSGSAVIERISPIPRVPIYFPRGGGYYLSMPVQAGDPVMVIVADRALGRWLDTGSVIDPGDWRTHTLAGCWAYPGGGASTEIVDDADAEHMRMGSDGGVHVAITETRVKLGSDAAMSYVALADLVTSQLEALKTAIQLAVIVPNDGGSSLKTTLLEALDDWPSSVAATKVQAE